MWVFVEFGGYGSGGQCRINVIQKIPHEGEVNRARYMPQNPFIIGSKSCVGDVLIFDYTKHPSKPASPTDPCNPDVRLRAARDNGFGLAWNPLKQGLLASTSEDRVVCVWDVMASSRENRSLAPLVSFEGHKAVVEDVAWHAADEHILASVSDDQHLIMYGMSRVYHFVGGGVDGMCAPRSNSLASGRTMPTSTASPLTPPMQTCLSREVRTIALRCGTCAS